ncbi:APC family permease [Pseudarthrobacter sp. AG30]|uniref:APC family permease n=1 Tax=Micrococcaceae TaxID=1268 RepID=UPI000381987F|nr:MULTISPECIES: APC family permease [Micrococcaceae]RAX15327.1 APC family permease [Pseudarthrobacter sp. AG30]TDT76273.1 amino acid/polyamine/organocation transporter (APC superfamily) [Arthrobacter sp. AG258]
MTETIRTSTSKSGPHAHAPSTGGVSAKGLKGGQLGLLAVVVLGISTIAPAYTLTSALGPTVNEAGLQLPVIFLIGFIPMILVSLAYRELNADSPDSGTTFTWVTKAFGPWIGWMGGWGLLAANIIVLSNLAGVAVDFFYLFLSQVTGSAELADLADNKALNVVTCFVFVALAVWVSYRGMHTTKMVQYSLVGFQLLVLGLFVAMAFANWSTSETAIPFSWDWFDVTKIETFGQVAAGISLSIFVYWGWDVCLTVNEETANGKKTAGVAGTLTAVIVLAIYLLVSIATMMFAGVGDTGNGLNNAENHENIFTALASPIMGPFAILMSLAVLSSSAASLQSTFMSPSRSLLAMAHYGALPEPFSRISRKFATPGFATIAAGVVSAGFYAVMHVVSDNVLNDTILALGLMICFYYGLTALACTWYFRHSLFNSVRHFVFRLVCPVVGGVGLFVVFVQTAVDSLAPEFGSGSEVFGVGLVFILGVGILALGAVVMLVMSRTHPGFFRGETLKKDTPALVVPE